MAAELLTRREFWNRVERGEARALFVAVHKSWKSIADEWGIEATEIASEKLFLDICRYATSEAAAEARLSHVVFVAYFGAPPHEYRASDVFERWFPMQIKTPHYLAAMDAAWFSLEVLPGETSRDVFDRLAAEVGEEALPRGWDGQVG